MTQLTFDIATYTAPNPMIDVAPPLFKLGDILYNIPGDHPYPQQDDVVVTGVMYFNTGWSYKLKVLNVYSKRECPLTEYSSVPEGNIPKHWRK